MTEPTAPVLVSATDVVPVFGTEDALRTLHAMRAGGEIDAPDAELLGLAQDLAAGRLLLVRPEARVLDSAWDVMARVPSLVAEARR